MNDWVIQNPQETIYVPQPSPVNDWKNENPQGAVYILQEVYSSFVYALDGERVYALDGSPIQLGYFWTNQATENGVWIAQAGG